MNGVIWVSWQAHRRTDELCKQLDIKKYCIVKSFGGLRRYINSAFETMKILSVERPRVLIVQNPSLILTVLVVILKIFFKYKLIVDAHNEGVIPYVNKSVLVRNLVRLCHLFSDLTIVTNLNLATVVQKNGGRAFVLSDPLPSLNPIANSASSNTKPFKITVISTFAEDEPIYEIVEATKNLKMQVSVSITGNDRNCSEKIKKLAPDFVNFTSFLPSDDYVSLISRSDLIVDLTLMKDCLVCGLYEALAVEVPILVSDDESVRELVSSGIVFTMNDIDSITDGLNYGIKQNISLKREIKTARGEYQVRWRESSSAFLSVLNDYINSI